MNTQTAVRALSKLLKQLNAATTSEHQALGKGLSELNSQSLRALKGILDHAIEQAESREEHIKLYEEKKEHAQNNARSLLLETIKCSDAYKMALEAKEAKSPEDFLNKLFPSQSKPTRSKSRKPTNTKTSPTAAAASSDTASQITP